MKRLAYMLDTILEVRELRETTALAVAAQRSAEQARDRAIQQRDIGRTVVEAACAAHADAVNTLDEMTRRHDAVCTANVHLAQLLEQAELALEQRQDHTE